MAAVLYLCSQGTAHAVGMLPSLCPYLHGSIQCVCNCISWLLVFEPSIFPGHSFVHVYKPNTLIVTSAQVLSSCAAFVTSGSSLPA